MLLGLTACLGAYNVRAASLNLSVGAGMVAYALIFLAGFASLLYGTGLILLDNNLWGS